MQITQDRAVYIAKTLGYQGDASGVAKWLSENDHTVKIKESPTAISTKALLVNQGDAKSVTVTQIDDGDGMAEESYSASAKNAKKAITLEDVDAVVKSRIDDVAKQFAARPSVEVGGAEPAEYAAYNAAKNRVFKDAKDADLFLSGLTLAGGLGQTLKHKELTDRALLTFKRFQPNVAKDYTSGVGSLDALMMPVLSADVIRLFNSFGKLAAVSNVVTLTEGNEFTRIRNMTETLSVSYPAETNTPTTADADFRTYTARTKQAMLLSVMSLTALRFSRLAMADEIARTFALSFQRAEDNAAVNGDGTSSFGGIVGLDTQFRALGLNNTGGRILGGGNWAAYTRSVFETALARVPAYANEAGLSWLCTNAFFESVMKPIARAAGGNAVDDISNWSGSGAKFLGRPVILSEVVNSNADTGTSTIDCYLGNFGLGLDLVRSSGMEIETDLSSGFRTATANIRGLYWHGVQCAHGVGTASAAGPIAALYQS